MKPEYEYIFFTTSDISAQTIISNLAQNNVVTKLLNVTKDQNTYKLYFKEPLPQLEKTALDSLVDSYSGSNISAPYKNIKQISINKLTSNITTTSSNYSLFFSFPIITYGGNLLVNVNIAHSSSSTNKANRFRLLIDNNVTSYFDGVGFSYATTNSCLTYLKEGLSAGVHTISLEWSTSGGTARCRPTTVTTEFASIITHEIGG